MDGFMCILSCRKTFLGEMPFWFAVSRPVMSLVCGLYVESLVVVLFWLSLALSNNLLLHVLILWVRSWDRALQR